jgi:hypothetical protein
MTPREDADSRPLEASRQAIAGRAIPSVCRGIAAERMMGFEPTTFCMANGSRVWPRSAAKAHG